MEINKSLPFEWCDTCPKFDLDAESNVLFANNKVFRSIKISCANRHLCEHLAEELRRTMQNGSESEH
jgi:hypothetical protein